MAAEIILQHWTLTRFAYPFLLMFFIVFAILEKTKVFGDKSKQLNALISFVISLIFVSAVYPKIVVANLILFLTISIIVVFVGLLLWGFVVGGEAKIESKGLKITAGIAVFIGLFLGVLWATGVGFGIFGALFNQSWSSSFWTNFFFVLVMGAALALMLKKDK